MAIENIWLIDAYSGICIFNWYSKPELEMIDEQLVSGLLIAFRNFSSEAGLVDISAIEGLDKKLAYKADDRFIIASICHIKDYEPLVNETLLELLNDFKSKFKHLLKESAISDVSQFQTFSETIENKLEGKTAARTLTTTLVGSIVSVFTLILLAGGAYASLIYLQPILGGNAAIVFFIELLLGMLASGFVGGLIAGERRIGMVSGLLTSFVITAVIVGISISGWSDTVSKLFNSLLYFIIFGGLALLGGLLGGFVKERRFFFPMEEQEATTLEESDSVSED